LNGGASFIAALKTVAKGLQDTIPFQLAHAGERRISTFLMNAAHYQTCAAASLANAEAAADKTTRNVYLAIAHHFYLLAQDEIGRFEGTQRPHPQS
jgi:hypothetical protein